MHHRKKQRLRRRVPDARKRPGNPKDAIELLLLIAVVFTSVCRRYPKVFERLFYASMVLASITLGLAHQTIQSSPDMVYILFEVVYLCLLFGAIFAFALFLSGCAELCYSDENWRQQDKGATFSASILFMSAIVFAVVALKGAADISINFLPNYRNFAVCISVEKSQLQPKYPETIAILSECDK